MPVTVLMSGNIHLGLGRVCDCVPGAVGRSRLSTSCVRQRSRSRGVRRSNPALFSCASRWGCWMIESCRPETATLGRTGQVVSEPTDSSPMRRAFDHELDCCYLRELSQTCLNPARDSFACPVRSVDCGSLPGRLGAIVTTFQRWAVRGEGLLPLRYVAWHRGGCSKSACHGFGSDNKSERFQVNGDCSQRNVGSHSTRSPADKVRCASLAANMECTRLMTGANYEKRNVDQCPPAGGEPDCHR